MTIQRLHHECFSGPAAAPALVLLHGWGLHGGVWHDFVPLLREHFSITVIDLPGFGHSAGMPWPPTPDALDAALLAMAPARAVWLGWSLGGLLALRIAARHPERVQALSLLAASPCFVQREGWTAAMPASVFAQFRAGVRGEASAALKRFLVLQGQGSVAQKVDVRFLQQVLESAPLPSADALLDALDVLAVEDARDSFSGLVMPVQVLLGAHDVLLPRLLDAVLPTLNPAAVIDVVPGAAHVPFVSHPLSCRDALLAFCRRTGLIS